MIGTFVVVALACFGLLLFVAWLDKRDRAARRVILRLLAQEGRELYGMELVRLSRGALGRGSVYVHLARLEEQGLVVSREEPALPRGRPRRLYSLVRS